MDSVEAPSDTIQWFRQTLDNRATDYLTFIDPDTELRLIICKDTPRMRNRVANPVVASSSPRHPLPSQLPLHLPIAVESAPPVPMSIPTAAVVSSPEYSGPVTESELATLELPVLPPTPPAAEPSPTPGPMIYTTTSHNRRKIQQRAAAALQKLVAEKTERREKKRRSRRRLSPSSPLSSQRVRASSESSAPPSSDDAVEALGPDASWFTEATQAIGQPAMQLSPPFQAEMLKNARSIAGPEAVQDWREILVSWREEQQLRLYSRPSSSATAENPTAHLDGQPKEIHTFYYTYKKVHRSVLAAKFNSIAERVNLANLHDAYTHAESTLSTQLLQHGQTLAAARKQYLFSILYPHFYGTSNPATDPAFKSEWNQFSVQLRYAWRWQYFREQLGFGVLGLIPAATVSNHWVQNQITKPQFTLWVRAIQHFNPTCLLAGAELCQTLHRAIRGDRPSRKRRTLEDVSLTGSESPLNPVVLFSVSNDGALTSGDELEAPASSSQEMDWADPAPFSFGHANYVWDDQGRPQPLIPLEYNLDFLSESFDLC
jgi:hypothetical protein